MASDDSEMKTTNLKNFNIDKYRRLVQTYISLHIYQAALFWADKVVALSNSNPKDVYWLAQCMYLLKQYHRAAHLLRSNNLDKTYVLCNALTVRCLLEANELNEALKILNSMDMEVFLQNNSFPSGTGTESGMFDDTPRHQVQSSVLLLKGKVLEAMDNRGLASDCYRQALQCDIHCFEAFESLIQHHMLTAEEEEELMNSLPIMQQCSPEEADILILLYRSKMKKYHAPSQLNPSNNKFNVVNVNQALGLMGTPNQLHSNIQNSTPYQPILPPNIVLVDLSLNTPNLTAEENEENMKYRRDKMTQTISEKKVMLIQPSVIPLLRQLLGSLDLAAAEAETLYYNCDYQRCSALTEHILKQDPYHSTCLPIHISCQVELKQSNKLFTMAHNLVDLYPNLAISWFAVGCYYYTIGKSDSARRYLAKATSLDRLFGPAWLAYGHSFAIENEHDQAMAAYFKASQLMRGCHLPLLYIGLECGLTNNIVLAGKFFVQAIKIAPKDPFVLQEMGVITFQTSNYGLAERHFRDALKIVKANNYHTLLPERWAPLLNNLGHTLRKQRKYREALECHQEALVLCPQAASTYSCIAYIHALLGNLSEAVNWFHKALGLRRDDTFSTTMLNYVLEHLSEDESPYPGAPDYIPNFSRELKLETSTQTLEDSDSLVPANTSNENLDMSMSIEIDMLDVIKE